jgi:hypothetical protein
VPRQQYEIPWQASERAGTEEHVTCKTGPKNETSANLVDRCTSVPASYVAASV